MTREEILAMPAGRELDAIVAKAIGYVSLTTHWNPIDNMYGTLPHYSTDISAAWEVVEKLQQDFMFIDIFSTSDSYNVLVTNGDAVNAEKAPEAICKAALIAVMEGQAHDL
jgi:hypothetical protein